MPDFLGIPQYIWNGVFEMAKLLITGVVLGIFATRYQKRKEVEFQIKGRILTRKIERLEAVERVVGELYHRINPPLAQEAMFDKFLDGTGCPFEYMEYPAMMNSEKCFDDYYRELHRVIRDGHNYMTFQLEKTLSEMGEYFTHLKDFLDAFSDTELTVDWGFSKDEAQRHIDMVYQLAGIAFQQDFDRFYCVVDREIARQMKNVKLDYGYSRLRNKVWNFKQTFLLSLEKYLDEKYTRGRLCRWIYYGYFYRNYGHSVFLKKVDMLILMMMLVHYSDRYTRDDFDNLPESQRRNLIQLFHAAYVSNLHV